MLKRLVGFFSVVILLAAISLLVFWRQPASTYSEAPPPVILKQAEVVDQGVQLAWLEAQSSLVGGYIIERSRDHDSFTHIARVEKDSLRYLDAEGRSGDKYRVIVEDIQQRPLLSRPSESIIAALPKPGSRVLTVSLSSSHVLGSATSPKSDTPAGQANNLKTAMSEAFSHIDVVLASRNFEAAVGYLHSLQNYQREILFLLPKLSPAEKMLLAQTCTQHEAIFEANLHILPENNQMDGMLVAAGCDAIIEAAQ